MSSDDSDSSEESLDISSTFDTTFFNGNDSTSSDENETMDIESNDDTNNGLDSTESYDDGMDEDDEDDLHIVIAEAAAEIVENWENSEESEEPDPESDSSLESGFPNNNDSSDTSSPFDDSVIFVPNTSNHNIDNNAAGDTYVDETVDSQSNVIQCSICFNNMVPREPTSLQCGHLFCKPCITTCIERKMWTCPICKTKFGKKSLRPIFL